jgi:hypothetical protein
MDAFIHSFHFHSYPPIRRDGRSIHHPVPAIISILYQAPLLSLVWMYHDQQYLRKVQHPHRGKESKSNQEQKESREEGIIIHPSIAAMTRQ